MVLDKEIAKGKGFCKEKANGSGEHILERRKEHRVTYKSGGSYAQIDYVMHRRRLLRKANDWKVVAQHKMVVSRINFTTKQNRSLKWKTRPNGGS